MFSDTGDIPTDSHAHTTTTISGILAADMGDADHGDVTWASSVASVEDDSHAHTTTSISGLVVADITDLSHDIADANGSTWVRASISEEITLSTVGATTDSSTDLLPANSIIKSVVCRVTTTITTATDWAVGDGTTALRFCVANSTMTAAETSVCLEHQEGGAATDATGPVQVAAAKLRITTTGTPGAGVIRCTAFYEAFTAPTS